MLGRARLAPVRHSLTHLYGKRSQQLGSWAGWSGGMPDGLVTSPVVTGDMKVEGANDVQRVESLAERTNRLAGKETRKALQNVKRNID